MKRPRIDLDGIPLHDPENRYMPLVIFRYRTTEGLVFQIPESGEVLVGWEDIESASVDLANAQVQVRFSADFVARQNWLRSAQTVVGEWLDRYTKSAENTQASRIS